MRNRSVILIVAVFYGFFTRALVSCAINESPRHTISRYLQQPIEKRKIKKINSATTAMQDYNNLIIEEDFIVTSPILDTQVRDVNNVGILENGYNNQEKENIVEYITMPPNTIDISTITSFYADIIELKREIKEVKEKQARIEDTVNAQFAQLHVKLDKILKNFNDSSNVCHENELKLTKNLKFPISEMNQIAALNDSLLDEEFRKEMVTRLSTIGGTTKTADGVKIMYKLVDYLFDANLMNKFSWTGSSKLKEKKECFQKLCNVVDVIYEVVFLADCRHSRSRNESFLKEKILKHTNQRLNRKSNDYPSYNYIDTGPSERLPPHVKTEYGIKTIQTGSVYIPPEQKGPVRIGPDHNLTKTYLSRIDTTYHHIPHRIYRDQLSLRRLNGGVRHHRTIDCVRCPGEKILMAKRGLDGVLIERPKLISCRNRIIANTVYQIETLFGEEFSFLLPHGTHSLHGKIRNKRNGRYEKSCMLRYKIVVQQCGRYFAQNEHLRVRCDIGSIWGSKCSFSCRKGKLSHRQPMVCGDNLQWEGDEPECIIEEEHPRNPCNFLSIPDNGKFSCQYNNDPDTIQFHPDYRIPDGSVCRIKCNRGYEIPTHLEKFNIFQCTNGQWNTTVNDLCQLKFVNLNLN